MGLTNFSSFLRGDTDWLSFLLTFFFHCLGAIGAAAIAPKLGLEADTASSALSFRGAGGAFTAEFYRFFFGKEMAGIFFFTCFSARSSTDVPSALWSIILISAAFWL